MLKVYKKSGSTFTDISKDVGNYHSSATTVDITAATDQVYIGSRFPFNSKYFKISSSATPAVNLDFKYLTGDGFKSPSDIEDYTDNFTQSGIIKFTPDRDFAVLREDTENIDELNTLKIYGLFWYEISFDVDTSFDINWIGHLFSDDDSIGSKYPDLNRSSVKTAFKSGKTDWEEQGVIAALEIERDLINNQNILDMSQLLDHTELLLPSIEKTAEIIYSGLGQDFEDQAAAAKERYNKLVSKPIRFIDLDSNARVTTNEFRPRIGNLRR